MNLPLDPLIIETQYVGFVDKQKHNIFNVDANNIKSRRLNKSNKSKRK